MNYWFMEADTLVRDTIKRLNIILENDGEDISYYNPEALDKSIINLINARSSMAIGRTKETSLSRGT